MSSSPIKEKKAAEQNFSKPGKEQIEIMSQMPEMYKKMTEAWLNFAAVTPLKDNKTQEFFGQFSESVSSAYNDCMEKFYKPIFAQGLPFPAMDKGYGTDVFKAWKSFFESPDKGIDKTREGMKEFSRISLEMSDKMREGYAKLTRSQFDFMQNVLQASKSGEPGQIMKAFSESSKSLLDAYYNFCTEETNTCFEFFKGLVPKDKNAA
jgi:hypothetical protein